MVIRKVTDACDRWRKPSTRQRGARWTSWPATVVRRWRWCCPTPMAQERWWLAEAARAAVQALAIPHATSACRHVSVTAGVAVHAMGDTARSVQDLLDCAGKALYRAKATGKNRVCPGFEDNLSGPLEPDQVPGDCGHAHAFDAGLNCWSCCHVRPKVILEATVAMVLCRGVRA